MSIKINQLDAVAAPGLKERFANFAFGSGVDRIEIDLRTVEFIDSSGVGALLTLYRRAPAGVVVHLCNVRAEVRAVLELLRLHQVFVLKGA